MVFWCVMPYCLVNRYKLCGETCFCHLQVRGKKSASHPVVDRRLSALQLPSLPFAAYSAQKVVAVWSVNVSTCLPDNMASHPTRLILYPPPWEPKNSLHMWTVYLICNSSGLLHNVTNYTQLSNFLKVIDRCCILYTELLAHCEYT